MILELVLRVQALLEQLIQGLLSPAASGCNNDSPWNFDPSRHCNQTVLISGLERSFLVHLPTDYDNSLRHAVVFRFHGFDESGAQQEWISGFSDPGLANDEKVVI